MNCAIPRRRPNRADDDRDLTTPIPVDLSESEVVEELGVCDTPMDFLAATVLQSNLGGRGPDEGQSILEFQHVMPDTNLIVRAMSEYSPNALNADGGVNRNGIWNGFGVVNMASGSSVDLKFSFVESNSGAPRVMSSFIMSFFDADHGMSHQSRETITVSGFSAFTISGDSDLDIMNTTVDDASLAKGDGTATFSSTMRGGKVDNPMNPLNLNDLQERRTVAILFENKSEFTITAAELGYANPQGRNLFFAGQSTLVCPGEALCSSYRCPMGFGEKQDAEFEVCKSKPCTAADTVKCCTATPPHRAGSHAESRIASNNHGARHH